MLCPTYVYDPSLRQPVRFGRGASPLCDLVLGLLAPDTLHAGMQASTLEQRSRSQPVWQPPLLMVTSRNMVQDTRPHVSPLPSANVLPLPMRHTSQLPTGSIKLLSRFRHPARQPPTCTLQTPP